MPARELLGNPGFRGIFRRVRAQLGEQWVAGFLSGLALGVLICVLLWQLGCRPLPILTPPTGPGTDYPCGVGWVVCPNSPPAPHRACCLEGDVCGGYLGRGELTSCPAGVCCNEMNDAPEDQAKRDAGGRARRYSPKTED